MDVIAHELCHIFLAGFIPYNNSEDNKMIQEGLSDIFGIYIDSKYNNTIDWESGEDVPTTNVRDLSNVTYPCITPEILDGAGLNQYERSDPLRRWFHLISTGLPSKNIPDLGIEKAIEIVLGSIELLSTSTSYEDFRNATLTFVNTSYDDCSQEHTAIAGAWKEICFESETLICEFWMKGPNSICEEIDYLQMCIQGGLDNFTYKITIIGQNSTEFVTNGSQTGNGVQLNNTNCLILYDFPQFNYYPQLIKFRIYSPQAGTDYITTKSVLFKDCDGDDPTCEEYHNLLIGDDINNRSIEEPKKQVYDEIIVFDISGNIIQRGESIDEQNISMNGIVIYTYWLQGELLETDKRMIIR